MTGKRHDPDYRSFKSCQFALNLLQKRRNRRVGDRIAILGNLCDYLKQINIEEIERHEEIKKSFITSIYMLALLNDDLSLVTASNRQWKTHILRPGELPEFHWLPPRSSSLADLMVDEGDISVQVPFRLTDTEVSHKGLSAVGYLWEVNEKVAISHLREEVRELIWKKYEEDSSGLDNIGTQMRASDFRRALEAEDILWFLHGLAIQIAWKAMKPVRGCRIS
jgi:hypothetical protein